MARKSKSSSSRRKSPRSLGSWLRFLGLAALLSAGGWWLGRTLEKSSRASGAAGLPSAPHAPDAPAAELAPQPPRWLPAEARARLERRLAQILDDCQDAAQKAAKRKFKPGEIEVGVCVRELGLGAGSQWGRNVDLALRPASNMKLVTTAAALVLLGPDWKYTTVVEATGPLHAGVLEGDLVVRAGGDPLYDQAAGGEVEHLLAPLVARLKQHGLSEVRGDLVLDEGSFEAPAVPIGWPEPSQHWTEYCALSAGFSANRGCLTALVRPAASAGSPASVQLFPRGHGLPENITVTTGPRSSRTDLRVLARATSASVRGSIPLGATSWTDSFAHPDPVLLFASTLQAALGKGQITVRGKIVRQRGVPAGTPLASLESPFIAGLAAINTHSNNSVSDHLFLSLGHEVFGKGTRADAARASARALEKLGVQARGFVQIDGSGLSRENRASARQIAALLDAVLREDVAGSRMYLDSLATSGAEGTLEDRMGTPGLAGRVHAKTGFINGTSALAGIVQASGGRQFVFSVLVNYPTISGLNDAAFKPMQDALCASLAGVTE